MRILGGNAMIALFALIRRSARQAWNCGMPDGTPPQLLHGFRLFLTLSAALWTVGATGTAQPWTPRVVPEIRDGAVVTILIAAMCWCSAIIVSRIDGTLITLVCELARRRATEDRTHLQEAPTARSQSR